VDIIGFEKELLGNLWTSDALWDNLAYLCDACNGRFAGSADERRAMAFLVDRLQAYGLANVAVEPFTLRGWERGTARLTILADGNPTDLPCLALPGAPGRDLEAEILDVKKGSAEDYASLGGTVAGKIVFNSADGTSRAEMYRGACEAGAAAFIFSGSQPGTLVPTGSVISNLPAIGLAHEAIARLKRHLAAGPTRVRLTLTCQVLAMTAHNVVAEIPGSDLSQGWILVGGHYDGHDISQAAQDNGASTAVLLEAARLLAPLRGQLRAGLRFVLFSGEELGLQGSYAYAQAHAAGMDDVRLMVNADVLAMGMPVVLQTQASPGLAGYLRTLPLKQLDAVLNDDPKAFIMNSDHLPFSLAGLQSVWAVTSAGAPGTGWVHYAADTLDKIDPRVLRQTAATVTRVLLRMAAEPEGLPRARQTPEEVQAAVRAAGFESYLRWAGHWPF
jgi:Iap family predicted aminopeptidase